VSQTSEDRRGAFRAAMENFLQERMSSKLDKLAADDPKRPGLIGKYGFDTWVRDASVRAAKIHMATHVPKATHPSSKGTSFLCQPTTLPRHAVVGTHSLTADFAVDAAVEDAKVLDVYAFLKIECLGNTLMEHILAGDQDLRAALATDHLVSLTILESFQRVAEETKPLRTSTLGKQLYWLIGEDPASDGDFHLLAPLYASSFAHTVFRTINEDRFSEPAKAAQKAKWERRDHDGVSREYPNLAVQKFGGTKPQNISQLNSERGGNNYLLASLPPRWKSREVQAPWYVDSVLSRFGHSEGIWALVHELRDFLLSDPPPTMETRDRREDLIDSLIDGLVDFAQRFQVLLPAGWTHDSRCRLPEAERLWLDPGRVLADAEDDAVFCGKWHKMDWPAELGNRFGNWLNKQMGPDLPLGDIEARQWQTELLLQQDWAQRLHELRGQLDAPRYISTREGV
jgi:CRISPR-associated protein Csy1